MVRLMGGGRMSSSGFLTRGSEWTEIAKIVFSGMGSTPLIQKLANGMDIAMLTLQFHKSPSPRKPSSQE